MRSLTAALAAGLFVAVAACSPGGTPRQAEASPDDTWRTAVLRDVVTGNEFRIDDLRGKVVAIETMAVWCSNCQVQQREAQAALSELESPDVIYVSLGVDPHESEGYLAGYAASRGFTWRFAVASAEVSRSLVATFGPQILSPPSTPVILLDAGGTVVEARFGITGAAGLIALFEAHLP